MPAVTMWEGGLLEGWTLLVEGLIWLAEGWTWSAGEGGGGGEKLGGLSGKALVGFGLLSGGDSLHPSLTNVTPMMQ